MVVFIRPPGCVHVQPDRLISKSQPSPSRHGSMSHHCFVLMIRAVDRRQRSARPGVGAVPTLPSAQPRPQGWEGGVGSPWGPPGGLARRRPCPGSLPPTCCLGAALPSVTRAAGTEGLGDLSKSTQGAVLEGTTLFPPVSGTHVRAGRAAGRALPVRNPL